LVLAWLFRCNIVIIFHSHQGNMTKYLTLLRHGEAETGYGQKNDFERKLTDDGVHKLERLVNVLKDRELSYDLLLNSPAKRTVETTDIIQSGLNIKKRLVEERLYLGSAGGLLELISEIRDEHCHVILVGHNPGISGLLGNITGDYQINLSPGMMAIIEIHAEYWKIGANRGMGSLLEVLQ